ncbi:MULTISPECIES: CRISPR-associated CARF protein Csx1 [Metallosphaera]|nr:MULTISPECIES: CRISPR-associated CARF protein Csx1 [Metallosphaera]AKV74187.1 hypothetical protein MsedA_1171 [Metallosphaera sedula]AKV76426.1 hypothetical protein MsedB_1173 [Metallosphaera sedula]AKV78678.1 hypothetical protein MsedC_1171 [Metallosphaera sedula]AKV80923.1 hypothetical protein MsedD_1172 [Metallosphaera sedula]AKV83165.1 hypothetical protein MsedE_1174 [Metallosphaera sedula]
MSLVFAVVGDPKNYAEVNYQLDETIVRSKTSFSVFRGKEKIIIAGVSLCKNLTSFEDCEKEVKDYVIPAITSPEGGDPINHDNVIVAPNVMGKIKGNLGLFFSHVYLSALRKLLEKEPDGVVLDSTHGINYMSLLTKDALTLALSVYCAVKRKKTTFSIYNSDPYVKDHEPFVIREVNSFTITPVSGLKYVTSQILSKTPDKYKPGRICDNCSSLFSEKDVHRVAKAMDSGLFLYVTQKLKGINLRDNDEGKEARKLEVDKVLDVLERAMTVVQWSEANNEYVYMSRGNVETAEAHALFKIASQIDVEDLDQLESAVEMYCDDVTSTIVKQEISHIRQSEGGIPQDRFEKYSNVMGLQNVGQTDKRILYAHGGLPYDLTLLRKEGGKILIRYESIIKIERMLG